jgi:hypothetical protein
MRRRIGPKQRPFGEVWVYAVLLGLAMVWMLLRLDYVGVF